MNTDSCWELSCGCGLLVLQTDGSWFYGVRTAHCILIYVCCILCSQSCLYLEFLDVWAFLCAAGIPRTGSIGKVFYAGNDVDDYMPSSEEAILRGEYAVIRSLVRVLEVITLINYFFLFFSFPFFSYFFWVCPLCSLIFFLQGGVEGKRQVDKVIDKCDSMQVDYFMLWILAI